MNESTPLQIPNVGLRRLFSSLASTQPQTVYLRDGDLVLYRRSRSLPYQCRYRLADGTWTIQTTGKAALEHAIARACDIYDEARCRQRLGLAHQAHSFAQIAAICCADLRQQIDAKGKKTALIGYVSIIERAGVCVACRADLLLCCALSPSVVTALAGLN